MNPPPDPYAADPSSALFVIFRPVPGFAGYGVDTLGNVWSCRKVGRLGGIDDQYHPLKLRTLGPYKYRYVSLRRAGKTFHRYVHRLVLEAFIGPCPAGCEACHFDGDTGNNRLRNLRWDTSKANSEDGMRGDRLRKGEAVHNAKLDPDAIRGIRAMALDRRFHREIAAEFGVSRSLITNIVNRKAWKHVTQSRQLEAAKP